MLDDSIGVIFFHTDWEFLGVPAPFFSRISVSILGAACDLPLLRRCVGTLRGGVKRTGAGQVRLRAEGITLPPRFAGIPVVEPC